MDRLAGWHPPKFDEPLDNKDVRRYILSALSYMRRSQEQLDYIPDNAGAQNTYHNPPRIVDNNIHEARRLLHIAANNLNIPSEEPSSDESREEFGKRIGQDGRGQ